MARTVLDRSFQPISLEPVMTRPDTVNLVIHGDGPHGEGNRTTWLSVSEMRVLAYRLLAEAEEIAAHTTVQS